MASVTCGSFTIERLSLLTWKLVQNDGFGQYPFIYAVVGADKVFVVDTGVGSGGLRHALDKHVNHRRLPYVVICTHVHFDHIGNNFEFADCPILMSGRDPRTTKNYELFSLCCAHGPGAKVRPFTVTRWLEDGEELWLDDGKKANKTKPTEEKVEGGAANAQGTSITGPPEPASLSPCVPTSPASSDQPGVESVSESTPSLAPATAERVAEEAVSTSGDGECGDLRYKLTVLHTPGHTIDSLSLYLHVEKRLFVGDLVYPFTAISLSALGSAPADYTASVRKLAAFVSEVSSEPAVPPPPPPLDDGRPTSSVAGVGGDQLAPDGGGHWLKDEEEEEEVVVVVDELAAPSASSVPSSSSSSSSSSVAPSAHDDPACELFAMTLGMEPSQVAARVNAAVLVKESCGGSLEAALDLFLTDEALAAQLAPPSTTTAAAAATASAAANSGASSPSSSPPGSGSSPSAAEALLPPPPWVAPTAVVLSCGHVEAALDANAAFAAVAALCEGIKSEQVKCLAVVEDGVGEFSDGTFTVVAPLDGKWC